MTLIPDIDTIAHHSATLRRAAVAAGKLCFFGMGTLLHENFSQLVSMLGRKPDFFCDNAAQKWGSSLAGIRCLPPGELHQQGRDTLLVICVRNHEAILEQLLAMGFSGVYLACFERCYHRLSGIHPLTQGAATHQSRNPISVKNKWSLVTGSTRGIGRQIALALAQSGANVIIHGRRLQQAETVAQECAASGVEAIPVAADLGKPAELESLISWLGQSAPPVDILYNNAGISPSNDGGFWQMPAEAFHTSYAVNLVAPVRLCQQLIPAMKQRGFGRIVNVSSSIQKRPAEMAYACSKAALDKFAHDLQPELEGSGVMISQLDPGWLRTDMGGATAPHPIETILPGALLGAMLDADVNGTWFSAQDYRGMSIDDAIEKAFFTGACMPKQSAAGVNT